MKGDSSFIVKHDLNPDSTVIDVGAYKGHFAKIIQDTYQCKLALYEPVTDFYKQIVELFGGSSNVRVFNYGLSDSSRNELITVNGDGSTFIRPSSQHPSGSTQIASVRRVSDELDNLGVGMIDLLQVNAEGEEYRIIPDLIKSGWIRRIKFLQIQFHDFVPDSVRIRDYLRLQLAVTHRCVYNFPFVWEGWERLAA